MSEESIKKKINTAKKNACDILAKAEYKIEKASNKTFCINAARKSEIRFIVVGIEEIVNVPWFKEQIKNLEKWPNPAPAVTSKEVWIRGQGEHGFKKFCYENHQWIDENFDPTDIFNH